MWSQPTKISWRLLALVTSSVACNIQVWKETGDLINDTSLWHSPSAASWQWPKYPTASYDNSTLSPADAELISTFSPSPATRQGDDQDDNSGAGSLGGHVSDGLHLPPDLGEQPSRRTLSYDLPSLFAASSPTDLLDDGEIDELIQAQNMWPDGGGDTSEAARDGKLQALALANDGTVSRQMYRRFSRVIVYVGFPPIVVGFVTNVIALKVFRRLPQNVTNTYMTCLICFDMAYLLFAVFSHVVIGVLRATWTDSSARRLLQLYVVYKFFILSARQVIIMATAFMSLDRYLVIAFPFRTHKVPLFRRPRLLIMLTTLLILAFNSHKPLKRQVREGVYPGTNHTVYYLSYSRLYLHNHGVLDDLTIASSCLFQYCPLLAMLVANIALMASLRKHSQRVSLPDVVAVDSITSRQLSTHAYRGRHHSSHFTDSESSGLSRTNSTSKMDRHFFHLERHLCITVVAYSLLFFLLSLPLALLPILKKVFPEFNVFKSQHYLFLIYVRMLPLLHIINASINFFVFFIKGGAFRAGVFRLLRCRRGSRRKRTLFKLRSLQSDCTIDSHTERG